MTGVEPVSRGSAMQATLSFLEGEGGQALLGEVLAREASPQKFLTQSVSLFRLYYHLGGMEVVESTEGQAVLRLVGFQAIDPLFCRRQTGGLNRAIEIAGGGGRPGAPRPCRLEGDAFCEWDLCCG
jgi:hypothetical protein